MSRSKGLVTTERPYLKEYLYEISKIRTHCSKVICKIGQTPRSKSQGKKVGTYGKVFIVTMNTYVKFQSFSTHCSNVISLVG